MIETSSFFLKVSTFHKESFYAIPSTLRSLFTAKTAKKRVDVYQQTLPGNISAQKQTSSFFLKVSTFHKESFYAIPSTLRSLFTAKKKRVDMSKIVNKLCQAISQLKNMIETSSFFLKVSTFHKESFYAIPSTLRSLFTAKTAKKRVDVSKIVNKLCQAISQLKNMIETSSFF